MKATTLSLPQVVVLMALILPMTSASRSLAQAPSVDSANGVPRLELARGEDGKVTLAFTPVDGEQAVAYAIEMTDADGKAERIEPVETTDYTVHGLSNGRTYQFKVRAVVKGQAGPWSNALAATPVDQPGWDSLTEAFQSRNPTRNSNPFTMVHGDESEADLRAIMRAAYEAGFEGVTLHPYDYKDYLGPGQWDRWRIIFDQARRLGLCVWQQDDRNYASGFACSKVVEAHPEYGRTKLVEAAQIAMKGPREAYALDVASLIFDRDFLVAVTAYPEKGEPVDLTDQVVDGKLVWNVPEGKWNLFVVKAEWYPGPYTRLSQPGRLYIDFLNPKAVDAYIQTVYQSNFDELGSEYGRTFKGFFSDEGPVEFKQFTPDLPERFEKAKGYSIRKYLPSLWRDLGPIDRKIRFDYRDFLQDANATVFFGRSRQWCHEHGVQFVGHLIEDHQQDMRILEEFDIPGYDNVFGQWYDPQPDVYWRMPRMASSISHYMGRRNDLALVEHFAATGWRTGTSELKRTMDWSTAMGLNQVVPCGLDTRTPPSWEVTPDFWLHGQNPQWPYFRDYQATANRMTLMMRGGRHVAPAIVLDTTESQWYKRGADLGWGHPEGDDLWRTCAAMGQAQVDFDLIPYRVFADAKRTTIDGATLRIGKEDYRAVVLPGVERAPVALVERLREFYDAGGVVVTVDCVPRGSCNGQEDDRLRAAVDSVWGATASGRGKAAMVPLESLGECLRGFGATDVRVASPQKNLLHYHRRMHGRDLYFFANTAAEPIATMLELSGVAGVPTFWDPVDGSIAQASRYANENGVLKMPLELGEYQSLFLVVDPEGARADTAVHLPETRPMLPIDASWKAESRDDYHRTFSTEFRLPDDWPSGSAATLELHGASQVLQVQVNGKPVGRRFCSPYRFEVGDSLRAGTNQIVVERTGRYSSPVEIEHMKHLSFTDDKSATAPCVKATLTQRPGPK